MERAVAKAIARCKRRDAARDELVVRMGGSPEPNPVMVRPRDVCMVTEPDHVSRSQLNSAARAMHSFVRKFPQYGLISGRRLALYERGDDLSAMWAKLNSQTESHVATDHAKHALEHLKARRNEPFVVHNKRQLDFRFTRTGRRETRRRKHRYDINLPSEAAP
jgi:hypothetical protein